MNLARYFRFFLKLSSYSVKKDLEYRTSFLGNMASSIGWTNLTLITAIVLTSQVGTFGGWGVNQMLLLSGAWMINNGLTYTLFYAGVKQLINDIPLGNLDFVLSKPIDSQFFVTLRGLFLNSLIGPLEGLVIITIALSRMELVSNIAQVIIFAFLIFIAVVIYYSLWFLAATLCIHFEFADNIFYTVQEIVEVSKFPTEAYPSKLAKIFLSFIPILVMTVFPAEMLMGTLDWKLILYAGAIGLAFFLLARWFWHWSLRRYTSASS